MMRKKKVGIAVALLSLAVTASSDAGAAFLDRAGVYVDGWKQSLTGDGRIDGAAGEGSSFSFADDVGLDGDGFAGEVGAWFHPVGRHRLRVSGFVASWEGESAARTDPLVIGDLDVPADAPVNSALDLRFYKAHYSYSVVNRDLVNVAILAGANVVDAKGEIAALDAVASSSIRGAVPVIGASVQVAPVGFLRVYGEISGANWKVGSVRANMADSLLRVEMYTAHVFGVGAGYRKLRIKAEKEDEGKIDVSTDGYQVYLLLRF